MIFTGNVCLLLEYWKCALSHAHARVRKLRHTLNITSEILIYIHV